LSFFAETDVIEGDVPSLRAAAQAKRNVGLSSLDLRKQAQQRLHLMEQRENPIPKKSNLVGNLLRLKPPEGYVVIRFDNGLAFRHEKSSTKVIPPYSIISENELLTFDIHDLSGVFDNADPSQVRHISLSEAMGQCQTRLLELWNRALDRIIRVQAVKSWRDWYYFPLAKDSGIHAIVTNSEKKLQVARAFYKETNEVGIRPELRFVFHRAFAARSKLIWNEPFVELRLRRIFTEDGLKVIEGEASSKIDAKFRRSLFNRSETQLQMLLKFGEFLFQSPNMGDKHEFWMSRIGFGTFLTMPTNWTPDAVSLDQSFISDYEEEFEDADN
jgi:hypothetical protein